MPNHVTNELYISFKDRAITEKFLEFVKGVDQEGEELPFTFNAIKPLPNGKWDYNWCWDNWGTKWDAYNHNDGTSHGDVVIQDDGYEYLQINFLTAWHPPTPILEIINDKFGDDIEYCRWFYRDEGDNFCGYLDVDINMNEE